LQTAATRSGLVPKPPEHDRMGYAEQLANGRSQHVDRDDALVRAPRPGKNRRRPPTATGQPHTGPADHRGLQVVAAPMFALSARVSSRSTNGSGKDMNGE
jgi:hypothetical protein